MIRTIAPALLLGLALLATPAAANDADAQVYARAITWLAAQQKDNGGYGQVPGEAPGEIGITGLVLKALADAPEPHRTTFRPNAEKAAQFILGFQQANGAFNQGGMGLTTYRTSICISALRAFDGPRYREQIAKAVDWLKGDQLDGGEKIEQDSPHFGGFGYDEHQENRPAADLSNTQLALAALRDAGVPETDPVFQRALVFLSRCQNDSETNEGVGQLKPLDDGGFIYDPGLARNKSAMIENPDGTRSFVSYGSMTYGGLYCLLNLGVGGDDGRVQAALRWIAANYTFEENKGLGTRQQSPNAAQQGLYYYYYSLSKCLSLVGDTVQTDQGDRLWARDLFDALAARQKPEGFFVNQVDRWWEQDPTLVTAYCVNAMNYADDHLPRDR
jgi:squalene-hopene/tetraprenyl-beta-curcumene cyclase